MSSYSREGQSEESTISRETSERHWPTTARGRTKGPVSNFSLIRYYYTRDKSIILRSGETNIDHRSKAVAVADSPSNKAVQKQFH